MVDIQMSGVGGKGIFSDVDFKAVGSGSKIPVFKGNKGTPTADSIHHLDECMGICWVRTDIYTGDDAPAPFFLRIN